jgi:hypothetical protein
MISIKKFSKLVLAALMSLTLHSCSDDGGGSAPASNADSSSLIQNFIFEKCHMFFNEVILIASDI